MLQKQKCVVVTGAAGAIGSHITRRLSAEGWRLHLIDIDADRLETICRELPDNTSISVSHLENPEACAKAIDGAGKRIDALVHMAGIFVAHTLGPDGRKTFDETMQHNAINAYDLVGAVLPNMSDGGAFVFASSLGFNRGNIDEVAYSMAKGAIVGLTRALSRRLGSRGIRSNAIAPGIIESRMVAELIERRGVDELISAIPLRRLGHPKEMAGAVAFLLSDDASYITGQVLNIDGGIIN